MMSLENKLEMRRIIITSNIPDLHVGRFNELLNEALTEAHDTGYAEGKNDAIDEMVDTCECIALEEHGATLSDNDLVKVAARHLRERGNGKNDN